MNPPICAVCGHPVNRFSIERSPECSWTVFVAECHGETQNVTITDKMLAQMPSGGGIHVLRAFENGALALESSNG
ncbi:hypothetical protein [Paraburkholderia bannensis]|uniref:hypothetical protein n=1 Tax=Paraburkholderia bannensis TaxID=765414 RepID=UPI002AB7D2FE|nr:hypothetical protein [Paraburkholderia bannensis]